MISRKWKFRLVSNGRDAVRRLVQAPGSTAIVGTSGFFALSLVVLFLVMGVRSSPVYENTQLERENALLADELEAMRVQVSDLEENLAGLARKDSELRILAGLDSIDEEILQVGVGGPGSPSLESQPLYSVNPERGAETFAASYDLHALERRAQLLRESMEEAGDSLMAHRDLLESTPSILPTAGMLTSGFSQARVHPIHNRELPHEGIDVSAARGTPIMAAAKGTVSYSGRRSGYGMVIEIDHGHGYSTLYGHASQLLARHGQEVRRGDVIARVGSTGLATSPHLHYEVRINRQPVNPLNYVISGAVP